MASLSPNKDNYGRPSFPSVCCLFVLVLWYPRNAFFLFCAPLPGPPPFPQGARVLDLARKGGVVQEASVPEEEGNRHVDRREAKGELVGRAIKKFAIGPIDREIRWSGWGPRHTRLRGFGPWLRLRRRCRFGCRRRGCHMPFGDIMKLQVNGRFLWLNFGYSAF